MSPTLRPATEADAPAMARLINRIIETGGTTAHQSRFDAARMRGHYIAPPLAISCFVAALKDEVIGFQALERADPDWQGEGKLPDDWAVIATFVGEGHRGLGVGCALFGLTLDAARTADVVAIDATIRADNALGLAYYSRMGFSDHAVINDVPLRDGTKIDRVQKVFWL
ncbi:MAG: GNAT family N-acetyltransferase [Rhodobacteraceae bacterium]|jgi:GNAT superfamily N-acetyltransferase|nr:GNAT family N-acetyltransferase [Paracoccaceae bacterium]